MKKIKLCIISLILILPSCALQNRESIVVYKQKQISEMLPDYLVLKRHRMFYDLYKPESKTGVIGAYEIIEDTLCLIPKFEYLNLSNDIFVHIVNCSEKQDATIPLYFLIKRNSLFEIMNNQDSIKPTSLAPTSFNCSFKRLKCL